MRVDRHYYTGIKIDLSCMSMLHGCYLRSRYMIKSVWVYIDQSRTSTHNSSRSTNNCIERYLQSVVGNIMDEDNRGRLTNLQYVRLGKAISIHNMESIALGYFNIDEETIKNLHYEHRGNAEAFNRDILKMWANMHSDSNQVKVSFYSLQGKLV